jgi:hypothetical protein
MSARSGPALRVKIDGHTRQPRPWIVKIATISLNLEGAVNPLNRAIAVALITFGASVVGMLLQWVVPPDVLTASKGSVGAMVGLITLLLALVLGFLVFTAFSVYATQQSEAQALGPVIIELDVLLEQYGADVAGARMGM